VVTLTGDGFPKNTTALILWDASAAGMRTAKIVGSGRFQLSLTVPVLSLGTHAVSVQAGSVSALAEFSVAQLSALTTPTPSPSPTSTAVPTASPTATPSPTTTPSATATPTPSPTATPTASQNVVYLGATVDGLFTPNQPLNFAPLDAFEHDAGKRVAIIRWYHDWGYWNHNPPSAAQLKSVAARGAVPLLTWCPEHDSDATAMGLPAFSLPNIIAGLHDAYIRSFAQALAAYGGPVLLRFAHEMNGNWFQWGAGVDGNTPAQYVAAWRHVHDVFVQQGNVDHRRDGYPDPQ
jgi:Glycosyl hydrolase family 26